MPHWEPGLAPSRIGQQGTNTVTMLVTVFVFAALAVTQGMATASCNVDAPSRPPDNNFLYAFLEAAGYEQTCVSTVLAFCDPTQEGPNFLSLIQVSVRRAFPWLRDYKRITYRNI